MTSLADLRRREYPEPGEGIFLDNASWGVSPRSSVQAMVDFTRKRGRMDGFVLDDFGGVLERARRAAAALLDVGDDEIALAPNTSFGINLGVALAATREPGRIVVAQGEFPANVLPWLSLEARGFEVEVVPTTAGGLPDEDALEAAVRSPGTVALSVSAVQFATGYAADLERLGRACAERGALFVVDAIQGCGVVEIRPREMGAHIVATGAQKWLCGPWGSGFAWVARELHDELRPPMVSWFAVEGATDFSAAEGYALDWVGDARRYELATLGLQDFLGMAESLELLLGEVGIGRVRERIHALHAPIIEWAAARDRVRVVTPLDPARRAGIVALALSRPEAVLERLSATGIRAGVREGLLRLAPHWWVDDDEIAVVVRELETALHA